MRGALGVVLAGTAGASFGLGALAMVLSGGMAHLSEKSAACARCHVMSEHLDAWRASGHRGAATCNDCHGGRGVVAGLLSKSASGLRHTAALVTGGTKGTLHAGDETRRTLEAACRRCHGREADAMLSAGHVGDGSCLRCHSSVGHGDGFVSSEWTP